MFSSAVSRLGAYFLTYSTSCIPNIKVHSSLARLYAKPQKSQERAIDLILLPVMRNSHSPTRLPSTLSQDEVITNATSNLSPPITALQLSSLNLHPGAKHPVTKALQTPTSCPPTPTPQRPHSLNIIIICSTREPTNQSLRPTPVTAVTQVVAGKWQ